MKKAKLLKKIENKNNKNTYDAIVDIVSYTENIQYYSYKREDYKELVLNALVNNSSSIKYVSPLSNDYAFFCEEAVKQDYQNFLLINDSVTNYKELGIKAILVNPFVVCDLPKSSKYYYFFWKLAVFNCFSVLMSIKEDNKELFSLIAIALDKEPKAILYVDYELSIYNNLCKFAYSKDAESVDYMDINYVDKKLALEIIKRDPKKIDSLNIDSPYYNEAWRLAVSLNSELINTVCFHNMEQRLDFFLELINSIKLENPGIMKSYNVLKALYFKNKRDKEKVINSCDSPDEEFFKLLGDLDNDGKLLYKKLLEARESFYKSSKSNSYIYSEHECPIRVKTR